MAGPAAAGSLLVIDEAHHAAPSSSGRYGIEMKFTRAIRDLACLGRNLLARSLHERAYEHNPGFQRFVETSGLPFRAHAAFRKADLDARQALYQRLCRR